MALLRRGGATFVVCVLLSSVAAGSGCSFEYRRQPPSTTLNGCNPYQVGSNTIQISLECFVRRRAMINDEFEVRWFRENTTGAVEDLGLGDPNKPLGMDWFSRYHNTKLFNQAYSPSLLGKYWCQVINTTADPDQPLMRSNVFTLLAPGDYSGASCSETSAIQFVDNRICADLPDQPVNPTTTTDTVPVPTTTTQMAPITIPSTTSQPTATTALVTSNQAVTMLPSVTSSEAVTMLPSVTSNQAVTMLPSVTSNQAVTMLPSVTSNRAIAMLPSVTSNQAVTMLPSVTSNEAVTMLPSVTSNQAVTMLPSVTSNQAVTMLPSVTSNQVVTMLPSVTSNQAVTMLPSVTSNRAIAMLPSVISNQAVTIVTSAQTPAASSSPSFTPLLNSQEQISPFLYVIVSMGGIFLITIIVLIVVIAVMLMKKSTTDQKGVGIDNGTDSLNEMNAAPGKPEIRSFQKSIKDSPEACAEPILKLQRAGYPAPPPPPAAAANGGRNRYSAMNTPTRHVVNHHYSMVGGEPILPPDNNYSCLQHDTSPQQPASSPYSKLDHSQPNTNVDVPATALYSSLEDSNTPLYNTLQAPGDGSNGPDYCNITPNHSKENCRYKRDPPY